MRILLVEDELSIANFIREGLEEEGFSVDVADNGRQGLQMALEGLEDYDLLLLDWMLPGLNGIEICRAVRKEAAQLPIIFLTAKDTVDEVVFGLQAGANDYIRKPFAFEEMLARIRVLLRSGEGPRQVFRTVDIELDADKHQVTKNGKEVELTQKEFALLEYLLRNKGRVCRRTRIIENVWDIHFDHDTSVIDVYINFLRKKLDEPGAPSFIQTIRGIGYRVNEDT
ncbi:MAG: response regulator transcription factor [Saprospirales bacterium]|jgi:two-component system copper resistance phosphate regulon response regulator CusR|nr:response regulator transcription factor [Saprospirales bacterium]MBK6902977.1 response regulator transcription factor [Saprospirales bacterium]MBK7337748.1 response regulator transcription factor [Saprospirales bacterium]